MGIAIERVETRKQRKEFIMLPFRINAGDPTGTTLLMNVRALMKKPSIP